MPSPYHTFNIIFSYMQRVLTLTFYYPYTSAEAKFAYYNSRALQNVNNYMYKLTEVSNCTKDVQFFIFLIANDFRPFLFTF